MDGGGRRRARGEDEEWGLHGQYTCNATSFDTLYSITVVDAARISRVHRGYNVDNMDEASRHTFL